MKYLGAVRMDTLHTHKYISMVRLIELAGVCPMVLYMSVTQRYVVSTTRHNSLWNHKELQPSRASSSWSLDTQAFSDSTKTLMPTTMSITLFPASQRIAFLTISGYVHKNSSKIATQQGFVCPRSTKVLKWGHVNHVRHLRLDIVPLHGV